MKTKGLLIIVLLFLLILIIQFTQIIELKAKLHESNVSYNSLDDDASDLRQKVNDCLDQSIEMENYLNNYESLLHSWLISKDEGLYNQIPKTYKAQAIIKTKEGLIISLPENGYVPINTSEFELSISFEKPPVLRDQTLNDYINMYNNIFLDLHFDNADQVIWHDTKVVAKYSNLKMDDKLDIMLNYELRRLLNLGTNKVQIIIDSPTESGADYFPNQNMTKRFSGGYEYAGFSDVFTINGNEVIKQVIDTGASLTWYYVVNESVVLKAIKGDGDRELERVILPKEIFLGNTWDYDGRIASITGVDIKVDTPIGTFSCIKITVRDSLSSNPYDDLCFYYAKGIGLVYSIFYDFEDILQELILQ